MRNPNTVKAYNSLRERILAGELKPGTYLSAYSVGKELGMSRTPVREALRLLENDELVTIAPRLGAVVRNLSEDQFLDLLAYRQALEVYVAGKVAQFRTPEQVAQLKEILEAMRVSAEALLKNAQDAEALQRLSDEDQLFHRTLLDIVNNGFIKDRFERTEILQRMTIPSLMHQVFPVDSALQDRIAKVFEEHVAIFEAVRDGDRARAQQCMETHIENIFSTMVMRSRPTPALPREPGRMLL